MRNKLRFYNSVALTAQYVLYSLLVEELGSLEAVIFAVLKSVICRHPPMGVSIADESPKKSFYVRLDTIDLREVTQFKTISGGQQFIEDQHQKPFERLGELPLWRVVVAEHETEANTSSVSNDESNDRGDITFDVGFFYNHTMGDGMSGAAFHLDFLDALKSLAAGNTSSITSGEPIIEIPKLELLPSLEAAIKWPLSLKFIGSEVFKILVLGNKDSRRWTGPPVTFTTEAPPSTRLLSIILDSTTTSKISQLCSENKATITPLLAVLIARHMANAYPSYSRFTGTIAVQLRRFTGVTNRQMVDQASGVDLHFSTEKEKGYLSCKYIDWDVVRSCRAIIDGVLKSPANQLIILLKYLSNMEGYFKWQIGKHKNWSFELSNVGLLDGSMDRDGAAKFRRMVFSQSANVAEAPYIISVASVRGGDTAITLTWQEGILEDEKTKQVLQALEVELYQMSLEGELENLK